MIWAIAGVVVLYVLVYVIVPHAVHWWRPRCDACGCFLDLQQDTAAPSCLDARAVCPRWPRP